MGGEGAVARCMAPPLTLVWLSRVSSVAAKGKERELPLFIFFCIYIYEFVFIKYSSNLYKPVKLLKNNKAKSEPSNLMIQRTRGVNDMRHNFNIHSIVERGSVTQRKYTGSGA